MILILLVGSCVIGHYDLRLCMLFTIVDWFECQAGIWILMIESNIMTGMDTNSYWLGYYAENIICVWIFLREWVNWI